MLILLSKQFVKQQKELIKNMRGVKRVRRKKEKTLGLIAFTDKHQPSRMSQKGSPIEDPVRLEEDQWSQTPRDEIFSKRREESTAERSETPEAREGSEFFRREIFDVLIEIVFVKNYIKVDLTVNKEK